MADFQGCTCLPGRPPTTVTNLPNGDQLLEERCPHCLVVWGCKYLTLKEVIAAAATSCTARLLYDMAAAFDAAPACGRRDFHAVMGEIETFYGQDTADGMRMFLQGVVEATKTSHTLRLASSN